MAEAPPNIEKFNRIALFTLSESYISFPRPKIFSGRDMRERLFPDDEVALNSETEEDCMHAVRWLISEGFLSAGNASQSSGGKSISNVCLTGKGLTILGMPSSLSTSGTTHQTIYQRARDAASSGLGESVGKKVGEAMSDVLGGAARMAFNALINGGMPGI